MQRRGKLLVLSDRDPFFLGFSHFSKFRSKIKNMTCYLSGPGVEFEISTFFVNIFKNRSKFEKMKKKKKNPPRQFSYLIFENQ